MGGKMQIYGNENETRNPTIPSEAKRKALLRATERDFDNHHGSQMITLNSATAQDEHIIT